MLVDVRHRHRGQVGLFAHSGAEAGHEHGVGAEVVEEVARRPRRARCPRCRPAPPRSVARTRREWSGRCQRGGGAGRRGRGPLSDSDRRVLVDVRHRHRRQVGPLAHPGAEAGHQHRVGAEVVEEVARRPRRGRCPRCRPAPPRRVARSRRSGQRCQAGRQSGRRRRGPLPDSESWGAGRCPASTPTAGRAACALGRRSGPSAWSRRRGRRRSGSSTDTCSVPTMSASTSAKSRSQSAEVARVSAGSAVRTLWEFPIRWTPWTRNRSGCCRRTEVRGRHSSTAWTARDVHRARHRRTGIRALVRRDGPRVPRGRR